MNEENRTFTKQRALTVELYQLDGDAPKTEHEIGFEKFEAGAKNGLNLGQIFSQFDDAGLTRPGRLSAASVFNKLVTERDRESWLGQELWVADWDPSAVEPKIHYLENILISKRVEELWGKYGGHKTNISVDRAVCIAAGIDWAADAEGLGGIPTEQATVAYLNSDMPDDELMERFQAFKRGHGIESDLPIAVLHYPQPALELIRNPELLENTIVDLGAKVWIVDSFSAVSGAASELDLGTAVAAQRLTEIAKRTATTGTYLHHPSRQDWSRGNTLRLRALSQSVEVKFDDNAQIVTFDDKEKRRGVDGYDGISLRWQYEPDPADETKLIEAKFVRVGADEILTTATADNWKKAEEFLAENPESTRGVFYKALGIRRSMAQSLTDQWIRKGDIVEVVGKRNAKRLSLPGQDEQEEIPGFDFD